MHFKTTTVIKKGYEGSTRNSMGLAGVLLEIESYKKAALNII